MGKKQPRAASTAEREIVRLLSSITDQMEETARDLLSRDIYRRFLEFVLLQNLPDLSERDFINSRRLLGAAWEDFGSKGEELFTSFLEKLKEKNKQKQ